MESTLSLESRSLPEQAAERIEQFIINGTFKPEERIPSEPELASLLNVGRSTVREAIKLLVARNILEIHRGSGTYVCQNVGITDDPLGLRFESNHKKLAIDLCEVRMMVEPQLAALAARHATKKDIREMQCICDKIQCLIDQKENYAEWDIKLHTKIACCTNNLVVPKLIPIINSAIDTYVGITNFSLAGLAVLEHQKIVDAIYMHDSSAAHSAMTEHLKANLATLMQLEKK